MNCFNVCVSFCSLINIKLFIRFDVLNVAAAAAVVVVDDVAPLPVVDVDDESGVGVDDSGLTFVTVAGVTVDVVDVVVLKNCCCCDCCCCCCCCCCWSWSRCCCCCCLDDDDDGAVKSSSYSGVSPLPTITK